jgi:hypothetical protein
MLPLCTADKTVPALFTSVPKESNRKKRRRGRTVQLHPIVFLSFVPEVPEVLVPLNPRTVGRRTNIDPRDLAFGRQKFVSTGHKAHLFAFLLGDAPYAPISNITVAKPGATCWAKRIRSQADLCRASLTASAALRDAAARIAAPSAVSLNGLALVSYQSSV